MPTFRNTNEPCPFSPAVPSSPTLDQGADQGQRGFASPLHILRFEATGNVKEHDGAGPRGVATPVLDERGVVCEVAEEVACVGGVTEVFVLRQGGTSMCFVSVMAWFFFWGGGGVGGMEIGGWGWAVGVGYAYFESGCPSLEDFVGVEPGMQGFGCVIFLLPQVSV